MLGLRAEVEILKKDIQRLKNLSEKLRKGTPPFALLFA